MADPTTDGRMIRKKIADSDDFAAMTPEAAVLFCMIIPHLNTHGKLQGGPAFLKEIVCPKVKYLTIEKIPTIMKEISSKTDMKWFYLDERFWIHAIHFTEHQKLDKNKIGRDLLPTYSKPSPDLVPRKDKDKVEVKVEVKEGTANALFEIPTKEEIQESSNPKLEEHIKQVCDRLYEEKIFLEVHKFKNKALKDKKNLRAILHVLIRCYLNKPEEPWGYCQKIISLEDGLYNERDYIKTSK